MDWGLGRVDKVIRSLPPPAMSKRTGASSLERSSRTRAAEGRQAGATFRSFTYSVLLIQSRSGDRSNVIFEVDDGEVVAQ